MRIVEYDELPAGIEGQVQLLDMSAGWMPLDFRLVKEARKMGYPATDYFGVYAVENEEVLSMVRVLRLPFTTPRGGRETVAGIQGVVTRRDQSRRGLAGKLLKEVHRREKAAGISFALLWTGHANVAHNLYRSLGYLDVYTPELAMRKCTGSPVWPEGYELKKVRVGDAELIERLHAEATKDRLGFCPRSRGLIRGLFKLGLVRPESLRLIFHDEKAAGYVQLQRNPGWLGSDEVVFSKTAEPDDVLSLLESEAARGWLVLRETFVRDSVSMLKRRHYSVTGLSYYGLLALPFAGAHSNVAGELGMSSPRFTCHYLDHF